MNDPHSSMHVFEEIGTCGRIVCVTMAVCCVLYGLAVLSLGQVVSPDRADGSLIRNEQAEVVGSALIAQGFARPEYFWPRPSAVDYNASAAGGSNLSPANPELRQRVEDLLTRLGETPERPLPADWVSASGSGLDPHIRLAAAEYQAQRVAEARGLPTATVMRLLEKNAKRPGGILTAEPLVNVLLVNMALDRRKP